MVTIQLAAPSYQHFPSLEFINDTAEFLTLCVAPNGAQSSVTG